LTVPPVTISERLTGKEPRKFLFQPENCNDEKAGTFRIQESESSLTEDMVDIISNLKSPLKIIQKENKEAKNFAEEKSLIN
jgi:hypothetical protein